jgi:hypothetical protein
MGKVTAARTISPGSSGRDWKQWLPHHLRALPEALNPREFRRPINFFAEFSGTRRQIVRGLKHIYRDGPRPFGFVRDFADRLRNGPRAGGRRLDIAGNVPGWSSAPAFKSWWNRSVPVRSAPCSA